MSWAHYLLDLVRSDRPSAIVAAIPELYPTHLFPEWIRTWPDGWQDVLRTDGTIRRVPALHRHANHPDFAATGVGRFSPLFPFDGSLGHPTRPREDAVFPFTATWTRSVIGYEDPPPPEPVLVLSVAGAWLLVLTEEARLRLARPSELIGAKPGGDWPYVVPEGS